LIGDQALRVHLNAMGKAWDEASGLVDDLIADETDDPTETPEQEEAEEEVETARLDALMSLLGAMGSAAMSATSICMNLNAPDYAEPTPARYMEEDHELRDASNPEGINQYSHGGGGGIQNPNSSGQGHDPSHASNPHHETITKHGFAYSHSTPITSMSGEKYIHHTYAKGERKVGVDADTGAWESKKSSASGRSTRGMTTRDLDKHLSNVVRHAAGKEISSKNMERIQAAHDAAHKMHDHTTELGAQCNGMRLLSDVVGSTESHELFRGDMDMKKSEVIKSLTECECSGFTGADVKTLEAMTDEQLIRLETRRLANKKMVEDFKAAEAKNLELKALTEKKPTEAEALAQFPSLKALVDRAQAQETARKEDLVGKLKTAQAAYTEDELKALELSLLERLAKIAKIDEPTPDYSGRGLATRPGDDKQNDYTPPDPYEPGLKALREGSKAVN
jgi:hypothetical protein